MGFFSWLMGKPAQKPGTKAGAKKTAAKPAAAQGRFTAKAESREELIRRATQIHAEKRREFEKLDPEVREKLLRQAIPKKPDSGSKQ